MQQAYLDINGVRTSIATYGRWVEEDNKDLEDVILIIPGNPGLSGFYKMFMQVLHEKTKYPVWIVSHAGHEVPLNNNEICNIPPLEGNEALYGIQGQIEHKAVFIKKYVPNNVRLHLVGHSIGSYIIVELLKDEIINKRVSDVKLLFPTIEYMAETDHGKFLNTLIKPIVFLIAFFAWIFTILPKFLQVFFVYIYAKLNCVQRFQFKPIIQLINPEVLRKVFYMAFDELDKIKERNNDVIIKNLKKIKLFYGEKDKWAPKSYCDKIKNDIPGIDAICEDYNHAFVLRQSREIGNKVASWF